MLITSTVQADSPFGALLRRTLHIPAEVDLSHSFATNPNYQHYLAASNYGYARFHIGGVEQGVVQSGGTGDDFVESDRHLCFNSKMNLIRDSISPGNEYQGVVDPGQPLVFVSHATRIGWNRDCATRNGKIPSEINILIPHGENDWRYKGRYIIAYEGVTPPGALTNMDDQQESIIKAALQGHYVFARGRSDWKPAILEDWGVRLNSDVGKTLEQLRRKGHLHFQVFTFLRWDEESMVVWTEARNRLGFTNQKDKKKKR